MRVPPMIVDLTVASSRPVHLWLPVFLLWPFALVIGETRGMVIRFSNQKTAVDLTVQ